LSHFSSPNLGFWTRLELLRLWGLLEIDWMHFALWDRHEPFIRQGWNAMIWDEFGCQVDKGWICDSHSWLSTWLGWEHTSGCVCEGISREG
jgi:hypothetical protein